MEDDDADEAAEGEPSDVTEDEDLMDLSGKMKLRMLSRKFWKLNSSYMWRDVRILRHHEMLLKAKIRAKVTYNCSQRNGQYF